VVDEKDDEITVEGGVTWGAVGERLRAGGRRPLILAENLAMTVGGTLAVAGLGDTSVAHGSTASQVLRLTLVTPDGEIRRVGPGDKLFRHALGGAGTTGAIVEATLRVVRRAPTLVSRTLAYVRLEDFASEASWPTEQRLYELFQGTLSWTADGAPRVHVVAGNFANAPVPGDPGLWELRPAGVTAAETTDRFASLRALRLDWNAYLRPALHLAAPTTYAAEVLKQLAERVRAEPVLRDSLPRVGLMPFLTDDRFPLAPQGASPVSLAMLLRPQLADRARAGELVAALRAIGRRVLDGDAVRIGLTSLDLDAPDIAERQLGATLGELRALRAEVDPGSLCNRGVIPGLDQS
jgi:FAD/FMN-containing dehydrogenase